MNLFPQRQAAIKVLYEAASQLLSGAAGSEFEGDRRLCRIRVIECLDLAEKIAEMGPVKITVEAHNNAISKVVDVPFDLGYEVDMLNSASQENDDED